jgi:uncharacterized protein with PQ loop repeat
VSAPGERSEGAQGVDDHEHDEQAAGVPVNLVIELVGFLASAVSLVLWWPQAARVWRFRHAPDGLGGVSIPTQALLLANAALWAVYALLTGSFWVGAPGLVNAPLALGTIALVRRSRGPQAHSHPEPVRR